MFGRLVKLYNIHNVNHKLAGMFWILPSSALHQLRCRPEMGDGANFSAPLRNMFCSAPNRGSLTVALLRSAPKPKPIRSHPIQKPLRKIPLPSHQFFTRLKRGKRQKIFQKTPLWPPKNNGSCQDNMHSKVPLSSRSLEMSNYKPGCGVSSALNFLVKWISPTAVWRRAHSDGWLSSQDEPLLYSCCIAN
jgi:hypothetical protein